MAANLPEIFSLRQFIRIFFVERNWVRRLGEKTDTGTRSRFFYLTEKNLIDIERSVLIRVNCRF